MDPPFPIYVFNLVSSLKDKSAKGYPVKKVGVVDIYESFHSLGFYSFCYYTGKLSSLVSAVCETFNASRSFPESYPTSL